jgi:endonuclease/exonuclease/phosphatase family metal-dependent hydrolase
VRLIGVAGLTRIARLVFPIGLIGLIGTGLLGFVMRGPNVLLTLPLYIPLPPLGALSLFWGVRKAIAGHRIRALHSAQILCGLVALGTSGSWMIGHGPDTSSVPLDDASAGSANRPTDAIPNVLDRGMTVLHWNVQWGGSLAALTGGWPAIVDRIVELAPDILILSESPGEDQLSALIRELGNGWFVGRYEQENVRSDYWYRMIVIARWPVREEARLAVRNGAAVECVVERPNRSIRILAVDGKSQLTIDRTPFLHDVARICDSAAREGRTIDVVAGDFNALSRSIGFDAIASAGAGYRLASRFATGWRATWPSILPQYDIDHIWVRQAIPILSCSLFTEFATDHRGQIAELGLP